MHNSGPASCDIDRSAFGRDQARGGLKRVMAGSDHLEAKSNQGRDGAEGMVVGSDSPRASSDVPAADPDKGTEKADEAPGRSDCKCG